VLPGGLPLSCYRFTVGPEFRVKPETEFLRLGLRDRAEAPKGSEEVKAWIEAKGRQKDRKVKEKAAKILGF
jgi:hypothetical protein